MIVPRRTKKIPLRNHKGEVRAYALVDTDDYERVVAAGPWYLKGKYVAHAYIENGEKINIKLHRFIMNQPPFIKGQPKGFNSLVDHINSNKLDNRKINLRISTYSENGQNRNATCGTSRYRGVSWKKSNNRWQAETMLNGKRYNLGYFVDEDEAGRTASAWRAEHMPFSADARRARRSA